MPSVGNTCRITSPQATCVQDLRPTWESYKTTVVFSEGVVHVVKQFETYLDLTLEYFFGMSNKIIKVKYYQLNQYSTVKQERV